MTVSKCHEVFCVGFLMASEIDLDFRMQARFEKQKVLGKKKDKLISFSNSPSLKLKCNREGEFEKLHTGAAAREQPRDSPVIER